LLIIFAVSFTLQLQKIVVQRKGSEEKGLICDTLHRVAVASHTQKGVHCL
jgi:hypothetical protein